MPRILILISLAVLAVMACMRSETDETTENAQYTEYVSPLVALCRNIDYADTVALRDKRIMGKRIASIVRLFAYSDSLDIDEAMFVFLNGIKKDTKAIETAVHYAHTYLENPNSPMRNETLYIRFLQNLLSIDSLPDAVRYRAENRLQVAMLNRPGTIAADFRFLDRKGKESSLHKIKTSSTLLIFYDPECPHCIPILDRIIKAPAINSAIADGDLTVVAVYAEGKRDVWDRTRYDFPANWIIGYDLTGILDNDLYDLPAMPIIYLLDQDKRVLFKDANVNNILNL